MTLPNFLIIGVQKAGTSSVYSYLQQHPQVYLSPIKEPAFLHRDWEQYYAAGGKRNPKRIDTLEKYSALFAGVTDEVAIGEASANHLFYHETAIPQIQRYVPQAKLIAILRHPVERAYSDYLMHVRDGINRERRRSLTEQIRERSQQSHIIQKGFYYERIRHFLDCFGADQCKVWLYDDLQRSPVEFMQSLFAFLAVDSSFVPNMKERLQKTEVPKNQALNDFLRRPNPWRQSISAALKKVVPADWVRQLREGLIRLNSTDKSALPLSPSDRQALLALYREDTLKLQDLLGRDLTAWLQ